MQRLFPEDHPIVGPRIDRAHALRRHGLKAAIPETLGIDQEARPREKDEAVPLPCRGAEEPVNMMVRHDQEFAMKVPIVDKEVRPATGRKSSGRMGHVEDQAQHHTISPISSTRCTRTASFPSRSGYPPLSA